MSLAIRNWFRLEKIYLDVIDGSGNCFIIYLAKLELYVLRLWYSGLIFSSKEGITVEKSSFRKIHMPLTPELLNLDQKKLQVHGTWKRIDKPILQILFKNSEGNSLVWNCHHPKATTEILYNNELYKGMGYAETLILPIAPNKLPIDELFWGRFLSDTISIIWICWKGDYPLNRIFLNGTEYNDSAFNQNILLFDNGNYQMKFSDIIVIKKGKFANLFSGTPVLRALFNHRILNSFETKYKAMTIFSKNSVIQSKGWSIYEKIIWER